MKYCISIILLITSFLKSHSQEKDSLFIVFFVNEFKRDSLHVLLNNKPVFSGMLNTDPSTGQCSDHIMLRMSDSTQCLTLIEVGTKKKLSTTIKKRFKYLYIFRSPQKEYRFEYSNRLSLPE